LAALTPSSPALFGAATSASYAASDLVDWRLFAVMVLGAAAYVIARALTLRHLRPQSFSSS